MRLSVEHPEIEVTFVSCQQHDCLVGLRDGTLDVVTLLQVEGQSGFTFIPMLHTDHCFVVDKGSEYASLPSIRPDETSELEFLYLPREVTMESLEGLGVSYGRLRGLSNIDAFPYELKKPHAFTVLDDLVRNSFGDSLAFIPFDPPIRQATFGVACRAMDGHPAVEIVMKMASEMGI